MVPLKGKSEKKYFMNRAARKYRKRKEGGKRVIKHGGDFGRRNRKSSNDRKSRKQRETGKKSLSASGAKKKDGGIHSLVC